MLEIDAPLLRREPGHPIAENEVVASREPEPEQEPAAAAPAAEEVDLEAEERVPIASFPIAPSPDAKTRDAESLNSICWILALSITLPVSAHLLYAVSDVSSNFGFGMLFGLWVTAVVAPLGLRALLLADPGVITRSPEHCYPLPSMVAIRLRAGDGMGDMQNVTSQHGKATFCVRCLVWRPNGSHHCGTCGHCVREFGHHCGFYGRCIAGGYPYDMDCAVMAEIGILGRGNKMLFNLVGHTGFLAGLLFVVFALTCLISVANK